MDTYPNDGYDYVTDPDGRVDQGMLDAGAEEFLLHLETAALQPEPKPAHVGRFAASHMLSQCLTVHDTYRFSSCRTYVCYI